MFPFLVKQKTTRDWYKIFDNFYFLWHPEDLIFFVCRYFKCQLCSSLPDSFSGQSISAITLTYWCLHTRDLFSPFFRAFKIARVPSWQQNAKLVKMNNQHNPWRKRDGQLIGLNFSISWVLVKIGSLAFLHSSQWRKKLSWEWLIIVSKIKETPLQVSKSTALNN